MAVCVRICKCVGGRGGGLLHESTAVVNLNQYGSVSREPASAESEAAAAAAETAPVGAECDEAIAYLGSFGNR